MPPCNLLAWWHFIHTPSLPPLFIEWMKPLENIPLLQLLCSFHHLFSPSFQRHYYQLMKVFHNSSYLFLNALTSSSTLLQLSPMSLFPFVAKLLNNIVSMCYLTYLSPSFSSTHSNQALSSPRIEITLAKVSNNLHSARFNHHFSLLI